MAKIKMWEIAVLILIVAIAYIISLYVKPAEEVEAPKFLIPEGASDDYIIEQAYKNANEDICEYLDDDSEREVCLGRVENKKVLNEGVEQVNEQISGASSDDKKLLGKALLRKDASLCEQIVDEDTKQKCFEGVS